MAEGSDSFDIDDDDIASRVYGEGDVGPALTTLTKKRGFAPWHHPVKQIVRDYQWGMAAERLLAKGRAAEQRGVLRYFTLPGADLLDVRQLAKSIKRFGSRIEYFGFNSGWKPDAEADAAENSSGAYLSAESALRQAGTITDTSVVWPDRLEDIARLKSTAADRLQQQGAFDIVNIDACDHLGYASEGREHTLFDAVETLLAHQLRAGKTWLLFITTRVDPKLLGAPAEKLRAAITENLKLHPNEFGDALADCVGVEKSTLISELNDVWASHDERLLKLFVLALGKHLLQFYCAQPNFSNQVELVSAFAYRVHGDLPDMLSIAFRVTPKGIRIHPAAAAPVVTVEQVELAAAQAIAAKAKEMWDIDGATGIQDKTVAVDAISGTRSLLDEANYDLDAWKDWLRTHQHRPMEV